MLRLRQLNRFSCQILVMRDVTSSPAGRSSIVSAFACLTTSFLSCSTRAFRVLETVGSLVSAMRAVSCWLLPRTKISSRIFRSRNFLSCFSWVRSVSRVSARMISRASTASSRRVYVLGVLSGDGTGILPELSPASRDTAPPIGPLARARSAIRHRRIV